MRLAAVCALYNRQKYEPDCKCKNGHPGQTLRKKAVCPEILQSVV